MDRIEWRRGWINSLCLSKVQMPKYYYCYTFADKNNTKYINIDSILNTGDLRTVHTHPRTYKRP